MILVQAITIILAIICAWLNKVPVLKMRDFGASISEERQFHRANAALKIFVGLIIVATTSSKPVLMALAYALILIIQWLVFDIALNLFTDKQWHYLGNTARLDKFENKIPNAGKIKAAACIALIALINVLIHLYVKR